MPILLINKHSGQQIMVKGESVAELWGGQKSGRVPVEWPDGHAGDVMKDAVWITRVVPLDEHNKNVEAQQEAERKRQAEAEAKRKADEQAAAKPQSSRLKRLFGRKA